MSLLDGVLKVFKLPEDDYDDDYDDYDEDEEFDEDLDDVEEKTSARKKLFTGRKKTEEVYDEEPQVVQSQSQPASNGSSRFASKKVVPIKASSARGLEVVVIRPDSIEDSSEITDTLLSGKAVILNLDGINLDVAQRVIDYSAGSCYAMRGNLQKITNYIFLVTPANVDISGDIPEIVNGGIDLTSLNKSEIKF